MIVVRFLWAVGVVIALCSCSVPGSSPPQAGANEAIVELRGVLGADASQPLSLRMAGIDGEPMGGWNAGFKKRYSLTPGRHTLHVTGEFENEETTVAFPLHARAGQTYWIGGQFALRRGGYLKHIYTLQDSRGTILSRKEVVPR